MEISFGHKPGEKPAPAPKKKEEQAAADASSVQDQIMTVTRRLRVLEEQQTNIRRKLQMIEQNMLSSNKRTGDEIKTTNSDIMEVKRIMSGMETNLMLIIKELKETAHKEEVDVLTKYINLWEPVNFVTRDEVRKIIEELLETK